MLFNLLEWTAAPERSILLLAGRRAEQRAVHSCGWFCSVLWRRNSTKPSVRPTGAEVRDRSGRSV